VSNYRPTGPQFVVARGATQYTEEKQGLDDDPHLDWRGQKLRPQSEAMRGGAARSSHSAGTQYAKLVLAEARPSSDEAPAGRREAVGWDRGGRFVLGRDLTVRGRGNLTDGLAEGKGESQFIWLLAPEVRAGGGNDR